MFILRKDKIPSSFTFFVFSPTRRNKTTWEDMMEIHFASNKGGEFLMLHQNICQSRRSPYSSQN